MQTFFSEEGGPEDDRVVQLQMMTMPEDALVNRIVAQTSAQPGILTCMQNILSPATASHLRCVPTPPELQARPYRDIRRSYTNAVVFGVIDDSDGSAVVHLNPDDSTRVGPGRIIQLARLGERRCSVHAGGLHACTYSIMPYSQRRLNGLTGSCMHCVSQAIAAWSLRRHVRCLPNLPMRRLCGSRGASHRTSASLSTFSLLAGRRPTCATSFAALATSRRQTRSSPSLLTAPPPPRAGRAGSATAGSASCSTTRPPAKR